MRTLTIPDTQGIGKTLFEHGGFDPRRRARYRILDPVPGDGAWLISIRDELGEPKYPCDGEHEFVGVDPDINRVRELRDLGFRAKQADFLSLAPNKLGDPFDRIVMRPPVKDSATGRDYKDYIRHAWTFLNPGGVLVALTPMDWLTPQPRGSQPSPFKSFAMRNGYVVNLPETSRSRQRSGQLYERCLLVLLKLEIPFG